MAIQIRVVFKFQIAGETITSNYQDLIAGWASGNYYANVGVAQLLPELRLTEFVSFKLFFKILNR